MLLIPICTLFLIFAFYYKSKRRGNKFNAVSFIMSIYLIMGLSAIILYLFFDYDSRYQLQFIPMVYLSLCFVVIFYGYFLYENKSNSIILIENVIFFRFLEWFQIISSVLVIIFFSPHALNALRGDIHENRLAVHDVSEALGSYGVINTLASLVGNLFVLSIMLAFVNLATIRKGGSWFRALLLLLSSVVYIVYSSAYVGRDGFVFWILTFIFIFLIFERFLPKLVKLKVGFSAILISIPALMVFIGITIARFSDDSVILSIFDYAGAQIFEFNNLFLANVPRTHGVLSFNSYVKLINLTEIDIKVLDKSDWFQFFQNTDAIPWRFTMFIGTWFKDFGPYGVLIGLIILTLLIRRSLRLVKRHNKFFFSALIIFVMLSQIVLYGVFYYKQAASGMSQIALILIAVAFRLSFREKKVSVIKSE